MARRESRLILRPSAAPRWGKCPGSVALEALFPEDQDSPAAREGTAAHWYATEAVQGRVHGVGDLAPNGVPLDADMIEGGDLFVCEVLTAKTPAARMHIEQRLTMHGLIHPACEGTPDCALIDAEAHRLTVIDYKYGHRVVEPFSNRQLIAYAAGAWEAYEFNLQDVKGWEVVLTIVQPRSYAAGGPVRSWRTLGHMLWKQIESLSEEAERAASPSAPTTTGEQCRDCNGRHACEALQRTGAYVLDYSATNAPTELTPDALGRELKLIADATARLEARRTGLEEVALGRLRRGEPMPYWTIGHGQAREKWTAPAAEVAAMGAMFGKDLAKPVDVITPAQARKLLGVDAAVIEAYSEKPTGAAKLVPLDGHTAAKAFGA